MQTIYVIVFEKSTFEYYDTSVSDQSIELDETENMTSLDENTDSNGEIVSADIQSVDSDNLMEIEENEEDDT